MTAHLTIDLNVNLAGPVVQAFTSQVLNLLEQILTTQAEAAATLRAQSATLDATKAIVEKVGTETTALLSEVQTLKDIIAAGGVPVSAELQAAIDAVAASAQRVATAAAGVDAQVPDTPAP